MLQSLVVGLGRCGAQLHVPVLLRARGLKRASPLFADAPIVGYDQRRSVAGGLVNVRVVGSLAGATETAPPDRTVVHVCTPPTDRAGVLTRLAELGYRKILVEKPLAPDVAALDEIERLRQRWGLDLAVVNQWSTSALTDRVMRVVHERALGGLRTISMVQRKPRFGRSLDDIGHRTAFDVELPHSVALAVSIAGEARVGDAAWTDMAIGELVIARLGTARLALDHLSGVRTEILSDLTSPIRERRLSLTFERGTLTGHYPNSSTDHYSQLRTSGDHESHEVFLDDALTAFMIRIYEQFAGHGTASPSLSLHSAVVRLLADAKLLSAARQYEPDLPAPALR